MQHCQDHVPCPYCRFDAMPPHTLFSERLPPPVEDQVYYYVTCRRCGGDYHVAPPAITATRRVLALAQKGDLR